MALSRKIDVVFILDTLDTRPHMLFLGNPNNFNTYVTYMEGVFMGISISTGIDLEREISKWFQSKTTLKASNMVWFAQFEYCNNNLSDSEKIALFISTIRDFVYENSDVFGG